MAIGRWLLHAPPLRLVGTGQDRRRVGEGTGRQGLWLAHGHLQQALRRSVPGVALATGDVRYAIKLIVRQADMKIQPQRPSGTGHDRVAGATAVGTADQLADQPAVGNGGIAVLGAGCPPGRFGSQRIDHGLPVIQRLGRQQLTDGRQAGTVAEQLAQGDRLFACLGELGPVVGHRRIEGQLALADQLQGGDSGEGLGAGEQVGDGIAVPGLLAVLVGTAGPQVDHGFATDLDAQRGATLLGIIEQRGKGFAHCFELQLIVTLDLHPLFSVRPSENGVHCFSSWRFCKLA
ncbi:hypothetical protein D3C76_654090 [compost metagenome]